MRSDPSRRTVHRTARVRLRLTRGQRRRCLAQLRSAGDVWAWLLDANRQRRQQGQAIVANYQALCRELSAHGPFGELSVTGARSVLQRYATAWFEAAARRGRGERAGFPRRKRALFPVRCYTGTFLIEGDRVRLPVARGAPKLWVGLARELPYPVAAVRSVTLLSEGGRLFLDVTAVLPVQAHDLVAGQVAGVDLGIIHPFAVACETEGLLVSGRALRAEARLHLADTKARAARMGRKAPRRGQRGSRRWRKLRARQRQAEARHRRRIRQAQHDAAKTVIAWAIDHGVGTLVVGDPRGICDRDVGRTQNLRLRQWRRTHALGAFTDKAERAGIRVVRVDERGTSSTCPTCTARVPKPRGRQFSCCHCGLNGHRDLVAACNIAARGGGNVCALARTTHRRAGIVPARRDRRRQLMDRRRSCLAPGRLGASPGGRSAGGGQRGSSSAVRVAGRVPAPPVEDQQPRPVQQGKGLLKGH